MDRFFDYLNVNNFHSEKHKQKVFEEDFWGYLEEWETSVAAREHFSKMENKMLVSGIT